MHIGDWIPQAFFDLVGRVVPGAALLAVGIVIVHGNSVSGLVAVTTTTIPYTLFLLLAVLSAYIVATLLGAAGYAIWREEWKIDVSKIELKVPNGNAGSAPGFVYDAIQRNDSRAGARLAKLSAERHMSRVLILGFPILLVLNVAVNLGSWGTGNFWVTAIALLLGTACSNAFLRHLNIRSRSLMINYWYMIESDVRGATVVPAEQT